MSQTIQSELHTLTVRHELGAFLNTRRHTGKGVEIGTLFGAFATDILKVWHGQLCCVDPWINQRKEIYFDGANSHDMEEVWRQVCNGIGRNSRCTLFRMMSLNAVGKFDDGELDFVYLDGNHAVDAVRKDILAWWPKVKIGGVFSGHDFFTRYDKDTNSDALTAVMELCDALNVRPHITWDTSWWILKTEAIDELFRKWNLRFFDKTPDAAASQPVYSPNTTLTPVLVGDWEYHPTPMDLVVVLPVARFDWNLALKWLKWVYTLAAGEEQNAFTLVVWVTTALTADETKQLGDIAEVMGGHLAINKKISEAGYFGSPNQMIRGALEYCEEKFPDRAILWCEADTVPLRSTWVKEIREEYNAAGRPFMGALIREGGIAHLSGNAVYHPRWRELAPSLAALGQEECGWDSLCAHDIVPRAHFSKTIQQVWRPPLPITATWAKANIPKETTLFHQCKDGSLIDVLCEARGEPKIHLHAALCESTYETQKRSLGKQVGPLGSVGADRATNGRQSPHGIGTVVPPPPIPTMEIMIVTCKRDMDFLRYCLKSIKQFARGFSGVTVIAPAAELGLYGWAEREVKMKYFNEAPGKGMMHHEVQICRADEWCPAAQAILLMDADCMFWRPATPGDYAPNGKLLLVRERYAEIGQRNPNRMIWQKCVERAVGFKPEFETMVRHPQVHLREVFALTRQLVESHTGNKFDDYVLAQENSFPQGFAEHPTLGAVAIKHFEHAYSMVDYDHAADEKQFNITQPFQYLYRRDRDKIVEFWSHGGIKKYESDAQVFLQNRVPEYYLK